MPRGKRPPSRAPLTAWLVRRRGRRRIVAIVAIALLATALLVERAGLLPRLDDDEVARYDGRWFRVVHVIDGDTLEVDVRDRRRDRATTRVRLWGVDAPEMAWPEHGRMDDEPYAREATQFVQELVESERVRLTLEPHRVRGRYGRLLAHVHLADGTSLADRLLEAGLAVADDRWSHRDLSRHAELQRRARDAGRGMWAGD